MKKQSSDNCNSLRKNLNKTDHNRPHYKLLFNYLFYITLSIHIPQPGNVPNLSHWTSCKYIISSFRRKRRKKYPKFFLAQKFKACMPIFCLLARPQRQSSLVYQYCSNINMPPLPHEGQHKKTHFHVSVSIWQNRKFYQKTFHSENWRLPIRCNIRTFDYKTALLVILCMALPVKTLGN